jgi:hypothetical protein
MILAIKKIEMAYAELLSQDGCVDGSMPDAGSSEWTVHDFPNRGVA